MKTNPEELDLSGLIDMHIHTAPDIRERWGDDVTVAREAYKKGMQAILIKSHDTCTADRAKIARSLVPGMNVFGGIALNYSVGGINPYAVDTAIRLGAKQVWLPTHHSENIIEASGISLLDSEEHVSARVMTVLEMIRDNDVALGTGHISIRELQEVVKAARELGIEKIIITHPEAHFINLAVEIQEQISSPGIYFERCYVDTTLSMHALVSVALIADHIRRVGIRSTILSSDFGQPVNGNPIEGFARYLAELHDCGFSEAEIKIMAAENPSKVLGM